MILRKYDWTRMEFLLDQESEGTVLAIIEVKVRTHPVHELAYFLRNRSICSIFRDSAL